MFRKAPIIALVASLAASGLWLSTTAGADDEPVKQIVALSDLPTLTVKIRSVAGGNFGSYSSPSVGTTGTLDFKVLAEAEPSTPIHFYADGEKHEGLGAWYIPITGKLQVETVDTKTGIERIRLAFQEPEHGALTIELDRRPGRSDSVMVWFIYEYDGFIDSIAFGEALHDGPILIDQPSE